MSNIGQRIKRQRLLTNQTLEDVAKKVKTSKQTIQRYESGIIQNIPSDKIELLAKALETTPAYLMGWEDNEPFKSPHPYISILGRVIAGVPVEAVEDIIGKIQINEKLARTGNFYALEVKGDSMQPRLQEGDVVIVKEQSDIESGQIAIVCVNGDEYTIKKIKKSESGITLIPFNPAYEPIFYSNEEIKSLPVEIKGRVVQFHGNL